MKKIYSVSLTTVSYILFTLLVISYFLQVPFRPLAKFISIFALLFALANCRNWLKLFKRPFVCIVCIYQYVYLLSHLIQILPLEKSFDFRKFF